VRPAAALATLFWLLALSAGCGAPAEEDPPVAAPPPRNTLRWSTASENDNYGFDIYRSAAEDGPFETINERPVAGAGTTNLPQDYEYVDQDVTAGTAYYYYIESISMTGRRERVTPTARVVTSAEDTEAP
jgi:hypothetical protein